jgi:alkanesulfonate monooxygenase SsuD/methylene tetrahydromethanopterin reductase-like flavin-dependent oxidoreductase (luciferase family)
MIRFGIALPPGSDPSPFARLAEARGFDYLACGEHLAFHGPTTNAFVSLSVAAGATTSIRLLSAVTLLPLYPAALAAKLAVSLDVASGGRFTLGVGIGGEYPTEFEAVGAKVSERGARTDEALHILRRLTTEDDVTVNGRFASFTNLTITPKPARPVPFWIAGRKLAAQRRAARFGNAWMPYLCTPEQVATGIATINDLSGGAWHGCTALYAFTTVDADSERAWETAKTVVGSTYQQDFTSMAAKYLIAGTPAECATRVREYLDAGVDTIVFRLACAARDAPAMLNLITNEIVPAFSRQ